jgi:hypothetical protein
MAFGWTMQGIESWGGSEKLQAAQNGRKNRMDQI